MNNKKLEQRLKQIETAKHTEKTNLVVSVIGANGELVRPKLYVDLNKFMTMS